MTADAVAAPIVSLRDVGVYYHAVTFLPRRVWVAGPLSLDIAPAEFVGLVGPSGCGKTSIGKAVLNLIPTWQGVVRWCGEDIRRVPNDRLRAAAGWVCQEPTMAFSPRRRVIATIRETLAVHGRLADLESRVPELCDSLRMSTDVLNRYPFELSAGQIQRMVLLRVCMLRPRFVVLDEPTSSLDALNQEEVIGWLGRWRHHQGASALVIAHSRRVLAAICDRVVEMPAPGNPARER